MIKPISSLCIILVVLAPLQTFAKSASSPDAFAVQGNSVQSQTGDQTCVQVQVQGETPSALNCLNQQLQQDVEGANAAQPKLPLGADSASNQVGIFNEQSVREQYGQNFGISAVPYRPAAPSFNTSLHP